MTTDVDEATSTTGLQRKPESPIQRYNSDSEEDMPLEFIKSPVIGVGRARPKLIRNRTPISPGTSFTNQIASPMENTPEEPTLDQATTEKENNGNVETKIENTEISFNGGEETNRIENDTTNSEIRKRSERLPFTKPIIRYGNPLTY